MRFTGRFFGHFFSKMDYCYSYLIMTCGYVPVLHHVVDYVTEIDRTVLSLIYPAMNSSSSSVTTGINNCQPLVYTFNVSEFMHSNWITLSYYSGPKHKESVS